MLRAIQIKNFKSYREARLPLAPLTVLIGANASGKSNAIEAMRFLSWLAQGQKLSSIRYAIQNGDHLMRGKVEDLSFRRADSFEIGCEAGPSKYSQLQLRITIRNGDLHISQESIESDDRIVPLYRLEHPSSGQSSDVVVQYDNFARGGVKPRITCNDQAAIFTQLTSPATFGANHKDSQRKIPPVVRIFESTLSAMLFLDPVPAKMRDYSFPSEKQIRGDGENLSGALYHLWGESETAIEDLDESQRRNREDILRFIQSLPEQDISGVDFLKEPRGGVMVQLTETFGGQRLNYEASLLSDGTLRVLAIAAAMLSAAEGSLVVIEEIDNGVHPSRAETLVRQIQAIAAERQLRVLLTSHNPALLDALPDAALGDVVCCYRDTKEGDSRLVRLGDLERYPELVAQGPLGQLMTRRILDRFLKDQRTEAQRRQAALDWLKALDAEEPL